METRPQYLGCKESASKTGHELDTKCCMCGRMDDDGAHLLLRCEEVKGLWRELNLENVLWNLAEAGSAKEMMEKVLKLKPPVQTTVVLLLLIWWGKRNKWREEGRMTAAESLKLTD
jgi:hypothetical protein